MRRKSLLWTPLLAMLLLSIFTVNTYSSAATVISVQPAGVVDETLGPGESFSVDIVISDVTDLGGYACKLSYDGSILHVTDVTVLTDWFGDPMATPPVKIWLKTYDGGLVQLVVTLPLGTTFGISGSGTVATIDFEVDDYGTTILHIHDTLLGDPFGQPISHVINDGFFANVALPQLWIKDKGAMGGGMYPEWHVAPAGTEQTIYARIVNTGDVGCYIKVKVGVYCPMVGPFSAVWTGEAWIPPKGAHEVSVIVSAAFTETDSVGVYYVSGTLYFSLDGTLWNPYTAVEEVIGGRGATRDVPGNDATKFKTY